MRSTASRSGASKIISIVTGAQAISSPAFTISRHCGATSLAPARAQAEVSATQGPLGQLTGPKHARGRSASDRGQGRKCRRRR
jgi:hypothetical protein